MAQVIKTPKRFRVVNERNKVPVGTPNTFKTKSKANKRAREVRCNVLGKSCPRKKKKNSSLFGI